MANNISKSDLKKQDFLVLKQSRDDTVTKVVAPNGLQIGLSDERFQNPLTVKGSTIGEGGITGSLTQLVDGNPYLLAKAGILITTASNGQIEIGSSIEAIKVNRYKSATRVGTMREAGTTIPLTNSNMNIVGINDTDDYIDMFVNGALLRSGTIAEVSTDGTHDYYINHSAKTAVFSFDLQVNDIVSTVVVHSGSALAPGAGNGLVLANNIYDINLASSSGLVITNDELQVDLKSDGGLGLASGELHVDISNATNLGSGIDATNDKLLIYDADAGILKKVSPSLLATAYASLDIASVSNSLNESSLASGDLFAVADIDDSNTVKKITVEDFGQYLAGGTNAGIGESSGKLTVDLIDLPGGTIAVANDRITFIDADDSASKVDTVVSLVSGIAGTVTTTGLAASAGTLKIDIPNVTAVGTLHSADQVLIYDTDAGAIRKTTINDIGLGAVAPPGAQYVTLANDGTLSNERVLTAGDGIDITDGGAGSTVTMAVDVTDIIDTAAGIKESSNNIQVALKSGAGLIFDSGEIKIEYGSTSGLAAQGSNTVSIIAGDGLRTGGAITIGAAASTIQLDIQTNDFAGNGLLSDSGDLVIDDSIVATLTGSRFSGPIVGSTTHGITGSITKLSNGNAFIRPGNESITITTGSDGAILISASSTGGGAVGTITQVTARDGLIGGGTSGNVILDIGPGNGILVNTNDIAVDNSIVATLTGSVFSGHVGITGSLHATTEVSGSIIKASKLSGSLTTLENGNPYLLAGTGISLSTGSNGQITITGNVGDITSVTAGLGLKDGGNTGDVTLNIDNAVVATLSGSIFSGHVGITGSLHSTTTVSGSLIKGNKLTGSLTRLEDGSSYLVAGSNITIVSGSNGSVTITASTEGAGIIGDAEDGTYTDGLFTDFVSSTPTGTAIDRFNEVLKALAPTPAPDLDNIDCNTSAGVTALLSFGSSNDQSSESPNYISSNTAAGFSAVNVNGSYAAATSGNNIRKGVYNGAQVITGDLNEDVALNQNGSETNFVANSFGNGDIGTLKLEVNGSVVHSLDLTGSLAGNGAPGSGNRSQLNSNSSGFINLSQTGSAVLSNGDDFPSFQHRTGQYQIGTADQRNGWNYARVVHTVGSSDKTTNYVEWVNDNNADDLGTAGNSIEFEGSGSIHLSGVEYFQSGTIEYKTRVSNAYKYVYDNNNITFTIGNTASSQNGLSFSLAAQSKPSINTGAGETHTKQLHLTSSAAITANYFISGTITAGVNVTHPIKDDLSNNGQRTLSPILMYNLANNSTGLSETFRRENYRIISGSYNDQASVTNSSNVWNSAVYMTASNGGHSNGLQFYNQALVSPLNTLNSGNFSIFSNGPSQNPNYSGQTGTRTFYRWFRNETGSAQHDFSLAIAGSGNIVSHGTTLDTSKITVLVKLPGKTGWMDVAGTYVLDSADDNDGASAVTTVISKDASLAATNYINFGNISIADDEYVVLCVKADESWTGNVSSITVAFGAGTGTLTAVPDLDDIDCDQDGTDANLSFGSSKSISGLSNPTAAAGFSAANLNDLYQTATNSNNLRRSIFQTAPTLEGDLNEDVGSPGNDYVANAFSDANSGSLRLEVNGAVIHEVEITGSVSLVGAGNPGSGTDTSLNSDGSGFISLSNWGPGLFDNGVPRYSEIQRTAKYRIVSGSQRNGWNYARVLHVGGWGTRATNYIEWIVDGNADALASAGNGLTIFGDNSFSYMSGVKYFTSPSGSILTRISNIYKNVYSDSASAISFTSLNNCTATKIIQSGSGLSSTKTTSASTDSLQTLSTSTDSQNELLHVSGTIDFSRSKSLPGTYTTAYSCGGALKFLHPLKSPSGLTVTTQTTTNLLVWTPSDTSNANTDEYFTGESYRLVSGSYTAQANVSDGSNDWNSQRSMNDNGNYPTYATGLLIYDTYLIPPKDGGSSGDFRNHDEGGGIESPAGNVNYTASGLTHATRDYFRSFRNNTSGDRPSIQVTLYGDATIVGRTGANQGTLGANKNIFVDVSIPGKCGFLDLAKPSAGAGNYNEGDGCLSGDLNATVVNGGVTNTCTFNGVTADGTVSTSGEYIVVRVSASKNWTGYLDRLTVSWS